MSILDHLEARPGHGAEAINKYLWSAHGTGWDTTACWRRLRALGSEPGLGISRLANNNTGRCVLYGWLIPRLQPDGMLDLPDAQSWAMEIATPHQAWSWAWHFEPPEAWTGVSEGDATRCAERSRAWALTLQDIGIASLWWPTRPDGSHWTVWCLTQDRWMAKQLRELDKQAALHPRWRGMISDPGVMLRHHRLVRPPGVPSPHPALDNWAAQPLDINAVGYQPLTQDPAQVLAELSSQRMGRNHLAQLIQAAEISDPSKTTDPWGMEFFSPILQREAARLRSTSKEPQSQAWTMGCRLGNLVQGRLQQMRTSGVQPEQTPDVISLYQRAQAAVRQSLTGRWQDGGQQSDLNRMITQGLLKLQQGWDRGMTGAGVQLTPWTNTPEGYPRPWDTKVQSVDNPENWLESWTWRLIAQQALQPRSRSTMLQAAETCWQQMARLAPAGQTNRLQAPVSVRQVSKRWGMAPIVASRAIRQLVSDEWLDQVTDGDPRVRVYSERHRNWSSLARVLRIHKPQNQPDEITKQLIQTLASWDLDPGDLLAAAGWLGARAALILAAIQQQPKQPWTAQQLAELTHLSPQSVRYQMRRLQQAQMLRARRMKINGRNRSVWKIRPWAQQVLTGKITTSPGVQRWTTDIDPRLASVMASMPPPTAQTSNGQPNSQDTGEDQRGAFEDRWATSGPLARLAMLARSPASARSWTRGRTQARWDQARWQLACSLQRDGQRLGQLPTNIHEQPGTKPQTRRPWHLNPVLQCLQENKDPRAAQMVAWQLSAWIQQLATDPDPQTRHLVPHLDIGGLLGWLDYIDPELAKGTYNVHQKAIKKLAEHEHVSQLASCARAASTDSKTLAWCLPLTQRHVPSRLGDCPGTGTLPITRRT